MTKNNLIITSMEFDRPGEWSREKDFDSDRRFNILRGSDLQSLRRNATP